MISAMYGIGGAVSCVDVKEVETFNTWVSQVKHNFLFCSVQVKSSRKVASLQDREDNNKE